MRSIDTIVVHCSAGRMTDTAADICAYHTRPVSLGGRGWRTPGYHYIVEASGRIVACVAERKVANGVGGHNAHSVHVCYTGGVDQRDLRTPRDTRSAAQRTALLVILARLKSRYPEARIVGHRDLAAKACPSFDARTEYASL